MKGRNETLVGLGRDTMKRPSRRMNSEVEERGSIGWS